MPVVIRDKDFRIVSTSRNLRGILDYSRRTGVYVERLDLYRNPKDSGGQLGIAWNTGATVITDFASYSVLVEWVKARRVFKGAPIKYHG